jgi:hypothetical protein
MTMSEELNLKCLPRFLLSGFFGGLRNFLSKSFQNSLNCESKQVASRTDL